MEDHFVIAGETFQSRLIIGTGKYSSHEIMRAAHEASGAQMVTVAVRRVNLNRNEDSLLNYIDLDCFRLLPNTAGCYTSEQAIRTAQLAREALGTPWIKLEVIGDEKTLFPDNEATLESARILVGEGFHVMPYVTDDLIVARKLVETGVAAVMPLAAPIGSGLGIQNFTNLRILREQIHEVPLIVDAGVGTASDAVIAMEMGFDAVLMNTAIALSHDPVQMATAMRLGVASGRSAYLAGRIPRRLYASASSPLEGTVR